MMMVALMAEMMVLTTVGSRAVLTAEMMVFQLAEMTAGSKAVLTAEMMVF